MRQAEIVAPGPPENLVIRDAPRPEPRNGEVLIAVRAAGVNRPDLLQREGHYPPPPGASSVLGLEVAGIVQAVGSRVNSFQPGDAVCALLAGGGYAEFAIAPAVQCLPIPDGIDFVHAAAIPETYFTVWTNVFQAGVLQPGERLLVHGGSSGIGTTAIQLAAAWGAHVAATAGSDAKCEACRTLGAETVINYRVKDFVEELTRIHGPQSVDVVLDMVGGSYTERNIACLAPRGRLVQIAFLQGSRVEVDLREVMMRRLTITGSTLRARPVEEKGLLAAEVRRNVWPILEAGRALPIIDRVFPLSEVAAAHRYLEAGEHIGKVVLSV